MSLLLPGALASKAGVPLGLELVASSTLTSKGVLVVVSIVDPRDPFKRRHVLRLDFDTISAPKDAPKPDAPATPL